MDKSDLDGTGLTLQLSPDSAALLALYTPVTNRRSVDPERLHRAIEAQGYGELFVSEDALCEVVNRCSASPVGFTLQIGERRDATLALHLSEDLMSASITMHPACGGRRIGEEEVRRALADAGVLCGIRYQEIEAAVGAGCASKLVVAAGTPPLHGEDSQFISLIPEMSSQMPQLSEDDTADYRNLGDVVSVSLGDPLLRRSAPTAGVAGCDLTGRELPASDGCEIPFAENLTGVACDLHDCELLVAAISGWPVIVPRGVIVEPVLKLKRVDLSTGNLHFKGSLEIAGDVCEGMEVTATEQITVGGVVEAARVRAGGDIEVKGGVIGHGRRTGAGADSRPKTAQLEAGGSITVQFAENAQLTAGGAITVKELAMQSELTSGSSIRVGEAGGRKGHIIGGVSRAATLVHAIVIGSYAGVPTLIEVGVDPSLNRKLDAVKDALAEKTRLMEELTKTLCYLKENPGSMEPGLVHLKERVYTKYQGEIAELTGEKKRLQKRMEINAQARVQVEREAFTGSQIRIGGSSLQIEEDLSAATFTLSEEGICH
ncbi:MAG: hypothetical protein A2075_20365 [Geobacteraceae bacterium GWC2_58_44]|nr:MAG: hypothetical protein A2075_20365 [Geobacteraceae bacterium GWC2_58_44]HBG04676.1 DUF342 domain-containing protein [Geobacter sp.]